MAPIPATATLQTPRSPATSASPRSLGKRRPCRPRSLSERRGSWASSSHHPSLASSRALPRAASRRRPRDTWPTISHPPPTCRVPRHGVQRGTISGAPIVPPEEGAPPYAVPPLSEERPPREEPPPGEERPERRGSGPTPPPSPREEPPPGEERPGRRTPP